MNLQIAFEEVSRLAQECVIVDLSIGRPRGRPVLNEEDLGIPKRSLPPMIDLGNLTTWPVEVYNKMRSLENSARDLLYRTGRTGFGYVIPYTMFERFDTTMQRKREEYLDYVLSFAENETYEQICDEVAERYSAYGRQMYSRARILQVTYESEDMFVDAFVQKIMMLVPTQKQIREDTYFDITYKALPELANPRDVDDAIVRRYAANSARLQAVMGMRQAIDKNASPLDEVAGAFVNLSAQIVKEAVDLIVKYDGDLPNRSRGKLNNLLQEAAALQESLGGLRDERTDVLIRDLANGMRSPQANLLRLALEASQK